MRRPETPSQWRAFHATSEGQRRLRRINEIWLRPAADKTDQDEIDERDFAKGAAFARSCIAARMAGREMPAPPMSVATPWWQAGFEEVAAGVGRRAV